MQGPENNEQIRYWREIVERAGPRRLMFWFLVINLPIAVVMSAVIQWHNSVVGEPTTQDLLIRVIVGYILFGIGGVTFLLKARSLGRRK